MIKLTNVTKTHINKQTTFTSVNDVSFAVNHGEIVGIVGASGAGKSTVLRLLNGLTTPTSGDITINGTKLNGLKKKELNTLRQTIGTIFQGFNLLSALTVYENVALALKIAKFPHSAIEKRVDEVLALVNMLPKKHDYPRTLSGGEKQRVAIARALSNKPSILLCDEITSALDQNTTNDIIDLLYAIQTKEKLTIIFVSHELEVVSRFCSRVIVMDKGQVVEDGSTANLFLTPKARASKKLVDTLLDYSRFNKKLNYLFVYKENVLNEPILSRAITKFAIEPSILYAKSLAINYELYGFMIMRFNTQLRMPVYDYLTKNGIYIEELGVSHE